LLDVCKKGLAVEKEETLCDDRVLQIEISGTHLHLEVPEDLLTVGRKLVFSD
jgi:hypothetical protein